MIKSVILILAMLLSAHAIAQSNTFPSSGNVGIGTVSPTAGLDVRRIGSAGTPIATFNYTFANHSAEAEDNRPVVIRRSSSDVESLATYILDTTCFFNYRNDETASSIQFRIRNTDTESGGGVGANDHTLLKLYGGPGWAKSIFDSKVGIGVTSPSHKLEVAGTIRAEEIIVEAQPWADYVFEDGYKLPSLGDVEAHIEEHGRLPDMPSAGEVKEGGVSLGDSQRLLLQKVEELTLYVIEQQKQIDQMKQENRKLKESVQIQ